MSSVTLGIYEKALRRTDDWRAFFAQVVEGGFTFMDLSIDETTERIARLDWTKTQRREFRSAAEDVRVQIGGMCLSCHRKIGPGSADAAIRREAQEIFRKAIELCYDTGIPVVQVAGYYAYYEQADPGQRERYVDALRVAAEYAAQAGVMLGIENVDGNDVTSITKGLAICDEVGSAWLSMYPDVGNLAEQQLDTVAELEAGQDRMLAIHLKDVLPGQPRRIPMGTGIADFPAAFAELERQNWSGRMMIEMWNDDSLRSSAISADARVKIEGWLSAAGIQVVSR
ncbi:MAG: L-ribulose-5-phosphate 3-epimerase [Bifidobacterium tibiigranuli]|jgi:L-ribulose-5-phosphate 3-epimerase/hexulose-6-phosphate isomerase|uniref:L-ribulose-5-phosphate 3-epimerase n=1 Tax=Bifidobacterium tibiigranuli TaxID=2172043 RepID=UPI0023528425|nr:L-ribulose-5-phosphate 3-epimerase [Bifidobacterium tibiigranuli]MCH3974070.1 L-ribulose-5-phosphate 3-epimerase [Bifidobacterium tibiigranuli]MCH4189100.1 L-ribulose-5-phosphate 3-epimerase [Bifidobacterium tibiigranuli]MCH4204060.1 L-ribulose-5-phosphate 3-epimerase [Bifidobacterium tibiigranuli]MCH4274433.1 L-ribulose-5-phosphate 3-epimerase [Bifidobacterium tibiigranuli]MCI1790762.1 L-ribulose-5-phosphate 3-epimerase [Bifidobacterium tibiigranuli]